MNRIQIVTLPVKKITEMAALSVPKTIQWRIQDFLGGANAIPGVLQPILTKSSSWMLFYGFAK